jgi:hypothetical protein
MARTSKIGSFVPTAEAASFNHLLSIAARCQAVRDDWNTPTASRSTSITRL